MRNMGQGGEAGVNVADSFFTLQDLGRCASSHVIQHDVTITGSIYRTGRTYSTYCCSDHLFALFLLLPYVFLVGFDVLVYIQAVGAGERNMGFVYRHKPYHIVTLRTPFSPRRLEGDVP